VQELETYYLHAERDMKREAASPCHFRIVKRFLLAFQGETVIVTYTKYIHDTIFAEVVDLKKHCLVGVESKYLDFTSLWLLYLDRIASIE
jgi:hypothetical protein